jgi:hypothetical protein
MDSVSSSGLGLMYQGQTIATGERLGIDARRPGLVSVVAPTGALHGASCGLLAGLLGRAVERDSYRDRPLLGMGGVGLTAHTDVQTILVGCIRACEHVGVPHPESLQEVLDGIGGPCEYTSRASFSPLVTSRDRSRSITQPRRARVFALNELRAGKATWPRGGMAMSTHMVQVELNSRGGWAIEIPDEHEPVVRETFEDAMRRHLCELVVHDAFHRVLYRTLVSRDGDARVRKEAPCDSHPGAGDMDRRRRPAVRQTGAD